MSKKRTKIDERGARAWRTARREELKKAIAQYLADGLRIREAWVREYNKILQEEEKERMEEMLDVFE